MKKFMYLVLDTNEAIYADSGMEFEREWMKTHKTRPEGEIKLTVLATGEERMMHPVMHPTKKS